LQDRTTNKSSEKPSMLTDIAHEIGGPFGSEPKGRTFFNPIDIPCFRLLPDGHFPERDWVVIGTCPVGALIGRQCAKGNDIDRHLGCLCSFKLKMGSKSIRIQVPKPNLTAIKRTSQELWS
jgi:hypothetical protein